MAQEYKNQIVVNGPPSERIRFAIDALTRSPAWGWDWVGLILNDQARKGGDSGASELKFYTRNFPKGLDELMRSHPDLTLDCTLYDMSLPSLRRMRMKNNVILEESLVEDGDDEG